MKKKLSALLVCLLSVVLAFALVACGGGTLTISDTSLSLTVGDTKQLTLKEGENDVTKDANWESSDAKVVTVDSRGNVVAKAEGSATVTGTYNGASAKCEVSVKAKEVVTVAITDESGKEIKELTVDRDASVNVKATTSNGSKVTWAVSDTKYAVVEETADNAAKITGKLKTPDGSPVTVYATSGSARASLALTVTFTNAPAGYYDLTGPSFPTDNGSIGQNKVEQGKWAYWADMTGWNGGSVDIQVAEYLGEKAGSEAGTVHFKYNASSFGRFPDSCIQLTYRNLYDETARPNGLKSGSYYKLTCKITSDAAGTVTLNGTDIELKVGDNNVTVYFQHNDTEKVYGDTEYDNIYYTAIFLTAGQKLPAAELTLTDFKWEEFTPETLKTPTVTVSGDKATIADENGEKAASYNLGLFVGEQQVYVVPGAKKGENTLDLSKYEEGEYDVKAQAVGGDARYVTSAWSDGSVKLTVSHNGKTEYDVIDGTEDQAKAFPGLWYYSSEYSGLKDVKYTNSASATNPYGEVSFEITDGGSWYSNQFFFVNSRLAAGRYSVKFTIKASEMEDEAKIHINGKLFTIKNGDNAIEYRVDQNVGVTTISIQMGEPSADYQSTVSAIAKGKFTLTGFSFEKAVAEKLATPTGLTVTADGTVTVTDAASNAGKVSEYKILFCDADGNVKRTKLVANGGKINLNSIPNGTYYLKVAAAGDGLDWLDSEPSDVLVNEFKVEHGATDLELGAGGEDSCEDDWVYWASNGEQGCNVAVSEAKYSINADETISISAKFSVSGATLNYGFQLFHNDKTNFPNGTSVRVTLTAKLNIDGAISLCGKNVTMKAGEAQQLEVTRIVNYTGNWQGATLFAMNVNCETGKDYEVTLENIKFEKAEAPAPAHPKAEDYDLGEAITPTGTELVKGGEQDIGDNLDKWYYWYVEDAGWNCGSVVTVTDPAFANGVFSITYNGGSVNFCTQLFYKASNLDAKKQYFLTLTIETDKAVTVGLHGETYQLTAGTHTLTAIKAPSATSLSIQFNPVTEATTVKVSNVKWQEIKGGEQPEPPTPGTKYTPNYEKSIQGAEMTGQYDTVGTDSNPDTWVYWYVADASWDQGAPVTAFEAKFDGNAFVVSYKDGEVNYSVQIFYKNSALVAGQTYTLVCKINVSVETKAIINGKELTLNAGDNTITVPFVLNAAGAENHGTSALDFQFPAQTEKITLKISEVEWTAGDTTQQPPATNTYSVTDADVVVEGEKAYFLLKGAFAGYTEQEIKTLLQDIYFDFQENPYITSNKWEGDWTCFDKLARTVTTEGGNWTIKFDLSTLENFAYTAHFDSPGSDGNAGKDLKIDNLAINGRTVTCGDKAYTLVNVFGSPSENDFWGCLGLYITAKTEPVKRLTLNQGFEIKLADGKPCLIVKGIVIGYTESEFSADVQSMNDDWPTSAVTCTAKIENGIVTITIDLSTIDLAALDNNPDRCLVHIYLGGTSGVKLDVEKTPGVDGSTADGTVTAEVGSVEYNGKVYKANFRSYWNGRQMLVVSVSEKSAQPETPAGDKEIAVTPTEWYGDRFVKLSMSDADFALVKEAANCKVNGADVQPHGDGKGFLVDGTVLQVQLPEAYAAGTTYSVVWYDAQGNAIAHATFTCQQA